MTCLPLDYAIFVLYVQCNTLNEHLCVRQVLVLKYLVLLPVSPSSMFSFMKSAMILNLSSSDILPSSAAAAGGGATVDLVNTGRRVNRRLRAPSPRPSVVRGVVKGPGSGEETMAGGGGVSGTTAGGGVGRAESSGAGSVVCWGKGRTGRNLIK